MPSRSGLTKYYAVSKGVICPVKDNEQSLALGASNCHYSSRRLFVIKSAFRLLTRVENPLLSYDDLLLIGAGFRENLGCQRTLSQLTDNVSSELTILGTSPSVWRMENRSVAVGLSRYLGITISGTQKLIPQTTRKQHILDKWSANPARANPSVLNQALGVEISHCTGNARRISLRELIATNPIWSVLERQLPEWTQKQWGAQLAAALLSTEEEDIFRVWKDHVSHRPEMAEMVCCVLELLDYTGWDESRSFHSAVFIDNQEFALNIPAAINDWLVTLHDTHLTAAYVMTNEVCLECEAPDHSTSSCQSLRAFTVLQTRLATNLSNERARGNKTFILMPFNQHLKQVGCGTSDIVLLTPTTGARDMFRFLPRVLAFGSAGTGDIQRRLDRRAGGNGRQDPWICSEILDWKDPTTSRNTVYIRASKKSCHGKYEARPARQDRPIAPIGVAPTAEPELETGQYNVDGIPWPALGATFPSDTQRTSEVPNTSPLEIRGDSGLPALTRVPRGNLSASNTSTRTQISSSGPSWQPFLSRAHVREEGLVETDVLGQDSYGIVPNWGYGSSATDASRN